MGVHGYIINNDFSTKMVGDVGYLSGEWDDTYFDIFVMKEPDYNIMVMSTISGLTVMVEIPIIL